jgi:holo-[acyl-carrier protein] synthase
MKIFGIGTDVINISRIDKLIKKNSSKFINRTFTKLEKNYCEKKKNSSSFYAKRFAAKEAFSKALGTGIKKDLSFKNIEIFNNKTGKPSIKIKGKSLALLKKKLKNNKFDIHLSLSDDYPWASAMVIISYLK